MNPKLVVYIILASSITFSCGTRPKMKRKKINDRVYFVEEIDSKITTKYFLVDEKKYSQVTEYNEVGKVTKRSFAKNDIVGVTENYYYQPLSGVLDSLVATGYYFTSPNKQEKAVIGKLLFHEDNTIDEAKSSYFTISPDEYFTPSKSLILKTHWNGPATVIFGSLDPKHNFNIDETKPSDTLSIPIDGLKLFLDEDTGNIPFFIFEGHILLMTPLDTLGDQIQYQRNRIPFIHCVFRE